MTLTQKPFLFQINPGSKSLFWSVGIHAVVFVFLAVILPAMMKSRQTYERSTMLIEFAPQTEPETVASTTTAAKGEGAAKPARTGGFSDLLSSARGVRLGKAKVRETRPFIPQTGAAPSVDQNERKAREANLQQYLAHQQGQMVDWRQAVQMAELKSQNEELSDKDLQKIREEIARIEGQFRKCYENALLKDDALAGMAQFTVVVGDAGGVRNVQVDFKGTGSAHGQGQLKSCLSQVPTRLKLPTSAKGNSFQFGLKLKT